MSDTLRQPGEAMSGVPPSAGVAEPRDLVPYSDVEYVFEPHRPSIGSARQYIQDAWARRRFAVALAKADLRGPRATTILGELWGVLDPLFQAAIYTFLIMVIRGDGSTAMLTMIMSGFFFFSFSATMLGEGGRSIQRNKGLVLNSTFPRVLLPASTMYKALMALIPALAIYAVIHLVAGAPVGPGLFTVPLLFLCQLLISLGVALIFATLVVYIRDMTKVLDYVMRLLLFVTPVIYPVSMLPAAIRPLLLVNPLFPVFAAYQQVVLGGMPDAGYVALAALWAVGLPIVGFRVFVSHERGFAMRL